VALVRWAAIQNSNENETWRLSLPVRAATPQLLYGDGVGSGRDAPAIVPWSTPVSKDRERLGRTHPLEQIRRAHISRRQLLADHLQAFLNGFADFYKRSVTLRT
jgi:hypothetical protein